LGRWLVRDEEGLLLQDGVARMCPDDHDHGDHRTLRLRRRVQKLGAGLVGAQDGVVLQASSPWLHHDYLEHHDEDDDYYDYHYYYNFDDFHNNFHNGTVRL
jgi:hypothetical protein